ncbi:MAG TPA: hypothetical protein VK906_00435, partial [Egicoccus sp.]
MPIASPRDPGAVRQIIADSWLGVSAAHAAGVSESSVVRTSSPTMLRSGDPRVVPLEAGLTPDDVQALVHSTLPLTTAIVAALEGSPFAPEALTVARVALRFQVVVLKAMGLSAQDMTAPLTVVTLATGSPRLDERFNPPWPGMLRDHPDLTYVEVPPERLPSEAKTMRPLKEKLSRRLRLESVENIGYRLVKALVDRVGLRVRNEVLVLSENGILKEVAFHLLLRGMLPRTLAAPKPDDLTLSDEQYRELRDLLVPVIGEHLRRWVVPELVPALSDLFVDRACEA